MVNQASPGAMQFADFLGLTVGQMDELIDFALATRSKDQMAISTQTALAVNINRKKGSPSVKATDFNIAYQQLQERQAKRLYPRRSAAILLSLAEIGYLPNWVLRECDIGQIRLAAQT